MALAAIVTCQLMVVLDASVVNVALPSIRADLHFSVTSLAWVVSAYSLVFGGMLLLGGRTGDILGRRRTLLAGVAVFTLASLLGGLATSPRWLLAARAVQGAGAAFAAPGTLALLTATFPEGPQRNRALGVYSAVSGTGLVIGMIVGGLLTSVSWRWVMFINVPIGIAVLLLVPRFVREPERHPGRLDVPGALTATTGIAALVYGFIHAASAGWDEPRTDAALTVAAALLLAFVVVEARTRQPLLPLRLLAERNRVAAYANMLLVPAAMFAVFFFLTQFLQGVLGFSPLQAGIAFVPLALVQLGTARTAPRLLARFGAKPVTVAGTVLIGCAMAWLAQITGGTGYLTGILAPMVLFGLGVGLTFMPLNMLIMAGTAQDGGAASGLLQTMQRLGSSVGLAASVTVFDAGSGPAASTSTPQAFAHGLSAVFTGGVALALFALTLALFLIRSTRRVGT